MELLVLILYKCCISVYNHLVQDKKHQRRGNQMKNTDVRVYEEPLSDRKFSWDCQQGLTWEEFEWYCGDKFDLDQDQVSAIRTELQVGHIEMKIGRVTDFPRDEPVLVLGEGYHQVHVHLAICECSDCEVDEDIPSTTSWYV